VWVDGIHTKVRLGHDGRLCCLVMVGARIDGTKELVAVQDGYRESEESWALSCFEISRNGECGHRYWQWETGLWDSGRP
jgi:putative transposase